MNQPQVIFNIIDILNQYPQVNSCTIKLNKGSLSNYIIISNINFAPHLRMIIEKKDVTVLFVPNKAFDKKPTIEQASSILLEANFKESELLEIGRAIQVELFNIRKDRTYYYAK